MHPRQSDSSACAEYEYLFVSTMIIRIVTLLSAGVLAYRGGTLRSLKKVRLYLSTQMPRRTQEEQHLPTKTTCHHMITGTIRAGKSQTSPFGVESMGTRWGGGEGGDEAHID